MEKGIVTQQFKETFIRVNTELLEKSLGNATRDTVHWMLNDVLDTIETYQIGEVKKVSKSIMSARKKENLKKGFPAIAWDFEKAKVHLYGYGDKVCFLIPGEYKKTRVQYVHATPGGGASRLYAFIGGKRKVITNAPMKRARKVMERIEALIVLR